ncbi:hypothetical protein [Fundidesulfovibrio agrisoli]|uniref:hypothetical protein n=1 Tax=Fundidesulfovibrio agrisoli TaxID=2922717 RepID=UPI001FAD74DE|nr:hypothetical protein [Fundidesulfovibrio agrisoli]
MAVSSISRQSLIAQLGYLDPSQTDSTTGATTDTSAAGSIGALGGQSSDDGSSSSISSTSISQIASLLSKLSQLEKSDPDGFKEVAGAIAQDFHDAAPQCSDILQRLSMESLAGQFSNASLSGSLKDFNLGKATSASMRSYAGQSSLTLLDYLNGNQGSDLTSQISGMMQSNLGKISV